jgi:signal transduction histidine kinase
VIKDNGIGFDTTIAGKNGIGLRNIASRAELYNGSMQIVSSPGKGCEMTVLFDMTVLQATDAAERYV